MRWKYPKGEGVGAFVNFGLPPMEQKFIMKTDRGEKEITVLEYFQNQQGSPITKQALPTVNIGFIKTPIWIPAEFLTIEPNQVCRKTELNSTERGRLVNFSVKRPGFNAKLVEGEGANILGISGLAKANFRKNIGIEIACEPLKIPASFMATPKMLYKRNDSVAISPQASWNLTNGSGGLRKFRESVHAIVGFIKIGKAPLNDKFKRKTDQVKSVFESHGIQVSRQDSPMKYMSVNDRQSQQLHIDPRIREMFSNHLQNLLAEIVKGLKTGNGSRFIFMVLPNDKDSWIYAFAKRVADRVVGVHTVSTTEENFLSIGGRHASIMSNVASKANAKLGGINHFLDQKCIPGKLRDPRTGRFSTMIVGADVSHSRPNSAQGTPSINAVVATVDDNLGFYPGSMRLQRKNSEAIFYRDGVADSQYEAVRIGEIPQIKKACADFAEAKKLPSYMPKVTFVICSKRHKKRFYPVNPKDTCPRSEGSFKCGLLVSNYITSRCQPEFYLQSHYALKGTAIPAHYIVLLNEIGLTHEEIFKFTNNICYVFPRATKAVSYATPAYMADLMCARGQLYIKEYLDGHTNLDCNFPPKSRGTSDLNYATNIAQLMEKDHRYGWILPVQLRDGDDAWRKPWSKSLAESMFYL
ncbi:MAG: hypothetical protein M1834_002247 [Cirrosporium novae-zelandiae]|nr:MAG: hypothetical protein M1834_002247 [Cirrosporium novae-zelandiae]